MDPETDMIPFSPTISSLSSSDLDTESTGSFFHDRSTSLGTLMGVTFPEISLRQSRIPSRREHHPRTSASGIAGGSGGGRRQRAAVAARSRGHRRGSGGGRVRWWRLCREEDMARRTSLGDFLQVERRLSCSDAAGRDQAYYYGGMAEHEVVGGGPLFADGRVLPPPPNPPPRRDDHREGSLSRLPVLFTGICSGG